MTTLACGAMFGEGFSLGSVFAITLLAVFVSSLCLTPFLAVYMLLPGVRYRAAQASQCD